MTDIPEDVMRLAAETCAEHEYSAKNADATWSSVCLAIAEGIMADRASRIRSCLLDKPEAGEAPGYSLVERLEQRISVYRDMTPEDGETWKAGISPLSTCCQAKSPVSVPQPIRTPHRAMEGPSTRS